MDQPSQEYPPWLTPVPSVVTNAAGNPETVTGVSYIAPTYYGPSIPLGTLYSYGGYTFPPTVVWPGSPTTPAGTPTAMATTGVSAATTISTVPPITTGLPTTATVPPTTSSMTIVTTSGMSITSSTTPGVITSTSISTSATPSILTSTPVTPTSTLSVPSSLTTSSSSPITSTPSITSPTVSTTSPTVSTMPSSTSPGAPAPSVSSSGISNATGLSKGQLVGIVVASVLGLIFLFVLALFLYLWFKALKNRRQYATLSPIDDDYVVVPPGGRLPGEGSPRHSGEEHDSFLRPRGEISAAAAASSRPRGAQATANSNSSESTNSHASGFGVLLDKPSIGFTPTIPEEYRTGRPLSPSELERLGREDVLPEDMDYEDEEYTGAYAYSTSPPVLSRLDTAAAPLLGSAVLPLRRSKSSLPGEPEEATVHTARRVKVEDLSPQEFGDPSSSRKSSNGILGAIGLGGLANLARKSWFKHFDSPRHSGVLASELEPLSEKDIEAGHDTHSTERGVDSFGIRSRGTPVAEGQRPVSRVSAQSGASGTTQYHDAQSSLQGGAHSLTPPPRALTPVDYPPMTEQTWASSPLSGPPVYEDRPPAPSTPPRNSSQTSFEFPAGLDILDVPAPTALTHFASISSTKDSQSGCSFGVKQLLFPPPGLETIRAVGWADSPTVSAPGSYGGTHIPSPGDLDVLEQAPPEAENVWRSIAADSNRRGTFGTYVQGLDITSERASLYSMRSHLSPSTRSAGSAPFGMGSVNSNTSRPSAHSRSASSGMHSLVHQGSIPSDLRRNNGSASHSPALSAFGRPPSRGSARLDLSFDSSTVGIPSLVHVSPYKYEAGRSIASGSTTLFDISSRTLRGLPTPPRSNSASPLSANFQLNPPPWVGGLAHDWQPAP